MEGNRKAIFMGGEIDKLTKVTVQQWGEGNDCWWNVAKGQAGEGASAAEIAQLSKELQEFNKERQNAAVRENDLLLVGDEILLPLQYSIDEIQTEVGNLTTAYSDAQANLSECEGYLSDTNTGVSRALSNYQNAKKKYDEYKGGSDEGREASLKSAMDTAKQAYLNALQEQKEMQQKVESAKKEVEETKNKLEETNNELKELQEEYKDTEEENKEALENLQTEIANIDSKIAETTDEIAQAEQEAIEEQARSAQEAAKTLGVTENEDGSFALEGEVDNQALANAVAASVEAESTGETEDATSAEETADVLETDVSQTEAYVAEDAANVDLSDKEVAETSLIDGRRTKKVVYEDGTIAEFGKDENGNWKTEPKAVYSPQDAVSTEETDVSQTETDSAKDAVDTGLAATSGNVLLENGDMVEHLSDMQEAIGTEYLTDSNWWKNESSKILTQKDENDFAVNLENQNAIYGKLADVHDTVVEMENNLKSEDQAALKQYLEDNGINLTRAYLVKIEQYDGDIDKAKTEMSSYIDNLTKLTNTKAANDEIFNSLYEKDATREFMRYELGYEASLSEYNVYHLSGSDMNQNLYGYDGSEEAKFMVENEQKLYDDWSTKLNEVKTGTDYKAKIENSNYQGASKEQLDSLTELYNDFITNHYSAEVLWFDGNGHKEIKADAEALIKFYLCNGNTTPSKGIDDVIDELKKAMGK